MAVNALRAVVTTLVVFIAVMRMSVATDRLFFKDETGAEQTTVRAAVGENIFLECEAGGSKSPTIHWLHHGRRVQQGRSVSWIDDETLDSEPASLSLSLTKSRLYLDCLKPSDAGSYTCVAEIPTRRIARITTVSVDLSRSSDDDCKEKRRAHPARVYMWTSHRIELEKSDVQLMCRAEGDPRPAVMWLDRDFVTIKNDSKQYEVLDNGDLMIRDVNWANNMGLFRCVAENIAGSDRVDAFLYPTTEN